MGLSLKATTRATGKRARCATLGGVPWEADFVQVVRANASVDVAKIYTLAAKISQEQS